MRRRHVARLFFLGIAAALAGLIPRVAWMRVTPAPVPQAIYIYIQENTSLLTFLSLPAGILGLRAPCTLGLQGARRAYLSHANPLIPDTNVVFGAELVWAL